jgi:ketosteroid isomerase-like protein
MMQTFMIAAGALFAVAEAGNAAPRSDSAEVVRVVSAFHAALASGDSAAALALLASDALILESGDVETRAEYRSNHLPADIEFARAVPSTRSVVRVSVEDGTAWVASTSVARGQFGTRRINSVGAELVVVRKRGKEWKIVTIHWSSRAR